VTDESEGKVWARTVPDLESEAYYPVLEIDADTSFPLHGEVAAQHATAVLTAVAHAEYDAAVLRQFSDDKQMAVRIVVKLRDRRPGIDWPSPLQLAPGVSAFTGKPFLHVRIYDRTVGQWEVSAARDHALYVLESGIVADLDGSYLHELKTLGVDVSRARAVVDDLVNHRDAEERTS